MNNSINITYPSVLQSFGITGIVVAGVLLFSSLRVMLYGYIDEEASILVCYLLSMGIPFLIIYSIRKHKTNHNTFYWNIKNKRVIPYVLIGAIAALFGIVTPISSLIPIPESVLQILRSLAAHKGIFTFILMVIAAPILEELIFRGIILDGLLKKHSPIKSILISSFLFGLAHLNPWQFVTGFIIGIFSGWVYYRTKNLSLSVIIHSIVNLCGYLMRRFIDFEVMDGSLSAMYGGLASAILVTCGSILILTVCIYSLQKKLKEEKWK